MHQIVNNSFLVHLHHLPNHSNKNHEIINLLGPTCTDVHMMVIALVCLKNRDGIIPSYVSPQTKCVITSPRTREGHSAQ